MTVTALPAIRELKAALGEAAVLVNPVDLAAYGYDASYLRGRPFAVALPADTEEVAAVLRIASAHRLPVAVRGAGTGLAGGSVPQGGIALVTVRLKELMVDRDSLFAEVGAGVTTRELKARVEAEGLFYPPDPGSASVSTIGGNLATNAGGSGTFRWGPTRHYVLGLTAVLANGTVLHTGARTTKSQVGYDLTSLLLGSEGTLAVITSARLRLLPRPEEATATLVVESGTLLELAQAVAVLVRMPARPAAVELFDRHCLDVLTEDERAGIAADVAGVLLVRFAAAPEALPAALAQAQRLLASTRPRRVLTLTDTHQQAAVWRMREAISPAVARIKPTKISEDATVPVGRLGEFLLALEEIRERHRVHLLVFGHAGDGNLHPNVLCDRGDEEEMQRVEAAIDALFRTAVRLGGTLSGEHGVGLLKAPYLHLVYGEQELHLMRSIKALFDPLHILNPGKVLSLREAEAAP